jgi:hypothetical protein
MEIFLPTLESKMTALVVAFRFIVFAMMVGGFIFAAASHRTQGGISLLIPIAKAVIIVAAISSMDLWYPKIEAAFMDVADYIDAGYKDNPTSSADAIRESTTQNPQGTQWSWRRINESIYQAVSRALANMFIYLGTLVTVPMLILQYVLRWVLYLITPFALAAFMIPGFAGIGIRFLQQLLAIMSWPIGFAITNLVSLAVWTDFRSAVGPNPATLGDAMYSPLLTFMGGILATIVIIVGMVGTPVIMQMLFAQGHAFSGASANVAHWVRSGAGMIYGVGDRLMPRGGGQLAPPVMAAQRSSPPPTPPPLGAEIRPGI